MPFSLVNSTALYNRKKGIIYLFGGVSAEINLRTKYLCYFVYDIAKDDC